MFTLTTNKILTTVLIGVLSATFIVPSHVEANAVQFEDAVTQIQIDILDAYARGDQAQVQALFFVFFELLIAGDNLDLGDGGSFSGNGSVRVDTQRATNIDEEDARLQGEVDLSQGARAWAWFEYGEDRDELDRETSREYVTRDSDISAYIDDLDDDERYYFRIVAENRDTGRLVYGDIEDFETDDDRRSGDVDVDTLSAKNIDSDEATLRGKLTDGGSNVEVWFAFDEDDRTPSCSSNSQREDPDGDDEVDEDDIFELDIDGLDEDEKYYYRACAEDDDGDEVSGPIRSFTSEEDGGSSDDGPDLDTDSARDIKDDEAELRGSVDMNDFDNGRVFFVWGEDEDQVEDIENDFDEYDDIDEDGDDLQKQLVDSDLDRSDDYERTVRNLDDDTRIYFSICVEYEDEDDDETIECGNVEDFRTDD